ncbi:MAG: hypothetical protein ACXWDM_01355 [Nocardioides sp.]
MSFEDRIRSSIADHVDRVDVPLLDVQSVRRRGERRRALGTAATSLAVLAVVAGGVALGTSDGDDQGQVVQPTGLPALDFDAGARAFYDDGAGEMHLGGAVFDIGRVSNLDTSATTTPYGVVYFGDEQQVRLLGEDGTVTTLAEAPSDEVGFNPSVKYDAAEPLAAWLTRDSSGVVLTVYRLGADAGLVASTAVPCEGEECEKQRMAGIDSGKVFVRGSADTQVFDVADLSAAPVRLTALVVADVRNRVILGEGTCCEDQPLGPDWRLAPAEGPESLLTLDGAHEVYWSSTLRSTGGRDPIRLDVPVEGVEFVALDTDGTVLVAVLGGNGDLFFDCEPATGDCTRIGRTGVRAGDPIFLGTDM